MSILTELQKKLDTISAGRAFVVVPPPIQGIGNAGGFQMQTQLLGGSFDYAALLRATDALMQEAKPPAVERLLTTFKSTSPQVSATVDRDQAEALGVRSATSSR